MTLLAAAGLLHLGQAALEHVDDLAMQRAMLSLSKLYQPAVQVRFQSNDEPNELSHGVRIRQNGLHSRHLPDANASIALSSLLL